MNEGSGIERENRLFDELLDLSVPDRDERLDAIRRESPTLAERLQKLLDAHAGAQDTVAVTTPLAIGRTAADVVVTEAHPDTIGQYEIGDVLGEGGMGVVYTANQTSPIRRRVALKLIKAGMDSKAVITRFDRERQTLAKMDHPNVARVLDAGVVPASSLGAGRPYFVMELVDGMPITEYCDTNRLSVTERLEVFIEVCRGIHHAHQKGVIHRDIKPSNVLCVDHDGVTSTKIIDFGIAKAIDAREEATLERTQAGAVVGTPDYMSPEQADGRIDEIDTRSDVYSLGALLYELLCGETVFKLMGRSVGVSAMLRIVIDEPPERPSTRVKSEAPSVFESAERRATSPNTLRRRLQTDLDWIVLKALEKDRDRRYDSVSALADDVARYLRQEPVVAAPPTTMYTVSKFCSRHRVPVLAGAVAFVALSAGLGVALWQAEVARGQSVRALNAEAEVSARLLEVERIADFQGELLSGVDPFRAGIDLSAAVGQGLAEQLESTGLTSEERAEAREVFSTRWSQVNPTDLAVGIIEAQILEPALDSLDSAFSDRPDLRGLMLASIAERFDSLGRFESAIETMQRAVADLESSLGEQHADVLDARYQLAGILLNASSFDEAMEQLQIVLEHSDEGSGLRASVLTRMARVMSSRGGSEDQQQAVTVARQAVEAARLAIEEGADETTPALYALGVALRGADEPEDAAVHLSDVYDDRLERLGPDHPDTLQALSSLASLAYETERFDEAIDLFGQAYRGRARRYGDAHPITTRESASYAEALSAAGRTDEALELGLRTLDRMRDALGPDNPSVLNLLSNMAVAMTNAGRYEEAKALASEALARRLEVFGRDHPRTLISYNIMGFVARRQGNIEESKASLEQALAISRSMFPVGHQDRLIYELNMGGLEYQLGNHDVAVAYYEDVLKDGAAPLGLRHRITSTALRRYTETAANDPQRMVTTLSFVRDVVDARPSATPAERSGIRLELGKASAASGELRNAEVILLEAHEVAAEDPGDTGAAMKAAVADQLAGLYDQLHEAEPEAGHNASAQRWREHSSD